MFTERNPKYSLRDNDKLQIIKQTSTTYGIRSFTYVGAKLWNELPHFIKSALVDKNNDSAINTLKQLLISWKGPHDENYFNNYV